MKVRSVRYVDCEFCDSQTMKSCIVCGGQGYVELVVWKEVDDGPSQGSGEVREDAEEAEEAG